MKILVFGGGSDIAKEIQAVEKDVILVSHKECDIRKPHEVDSIIRSHTPEIVINCAGIIHAGLISEQEITKWEDQVITNLLGSFHIAQSSVTHGIKKIIFIGSVMGLYGRAAYSAYASSKAGVISLTQSLAMEGVDTYCISPGAVNTKMREQEHPDEDKKKRLSVSDVIKILFDCIDGKYKRGDNIIIRKRGFKKIIKVDRGQPWKQYLHI